MTVIVAVKDDEGISIGADRRMVFRDNPMKTAEPKIFIKSIPVINDEDKQVGEKQVVFGVAGYLHINSYINHSYTMPPIMECNDDFLEYLISAMTCLSEELVDKNLIKFSEGLVDSQCDILIISGNKMYSVISNFSVVEIVEDYYADGSANEIALGSLYTIRNVGTSSMKVETAIRACSEYSIYVDDNIDIIRVFNDGSVKWEKKA